MLTCPFARQVWALSYLPWYVISSWSGSSEAWVRTVHSRNKSLWENQVLNATDVVISANSFLLAFHEATPSRLVLPPGSNSATQWCKSPPGTIKLNFDAAFFKEVGNAGHAEALAAREAIKLAIRCGWSSIIIEGDCVQVIQKLQQCVPDFSTISPIISDVLYLVSLFSSCVFSHVRRSGNRVAHSFARLVCSFTFGFAAIPDSVRTLISVDIASFN
ncbi:hypothetical protein BUALT_Bualt04G0057500 [Buddleja alternifolia]|uniref:RNase H type-1 domain-containing protein n=1 Tax=Buddleja alternifolia TaxID=168488 RepID=A0AAV6XMZ0_9LAMI|nr:hypothetical protein BUALT_Bualt04G0057500 [Buddleja alternifolia]